MGFWLFCHLALFTIGMSQLQNSSNNFQNDTSTTQEQFGTEDQTQSLNTTSPPITETATGADVGIDDGDSGKADDLADYVSKKLGELLGGSTEDSDSSQDDSTTPGAVDLQDCSLTPVLDNYCEGVPETVRAYFQHNLSLPGILASIFKPDTVALLQLNCTPGSWCLPDIFHQDVRQSKNRFYVESPFCSSAMWACVKNMEIERANCSDELLTYLVNTIILLCDLEGSDTQGQECYARTVEALYVTYADMTRPTRIQKPNSTSMDCENFKVQMTKTYLCADDVCSYDQNLLLEKFPQWVDLSRDAVDVAQNCNISRKCQSDYEAVDDELPYNYYDAYSNYEDDYDIDENENDNYGDSSKVVEDITKEEEDEATGSEITPADDVFDEPNNDNDDSDQKQETDNSASNSFGQEHGLNTDSDEGYDNDDRSMLLGLIVMTTALLLGFVGLAFVVYRRFQRSRNGNYKWGYSQLVSQDPKLVHADYK